MNVQEKTMLKAAICGIIKGSGLSVNDAFVLLEFVKESILSNTTALSGDKQYDALEVRERLEVRKEAAE